MKPTRTASTRRRGLLALLLGLATIVPLGVSGPAQACDPALPPDLCPLIPSAPVDQLAIVGRTYAPSAVSVKLNSNLYVHNFDAVAPEHYVVFANGAFTKVRPGQVGPLAGKVHIKPGLFAAGFSYPFSCALHPEMQGTLQVL